MKLTEKLKKMPISFIVKSFSTLLFLVLFVVFFSSCSGTKWLNGDWEGAGKQIDGQTWDMKLGVKGKTLKIDYPGLSCDGVWEIVGKKDETIECKEKIINGTDKCDQGNEIFIKKLSEGNLEAVFYLRSYDPDNPIATAKLTKKQ